MDENVKYPLTICDSIEEIANSTDLNLEYCKQQYDDYKKENLSSFILGMSMSSMYLVTVCNLNESAKELSKKYDD